MVRNTIRRLIEDGKLSTWLDEDEHAESFEAICSALSASPEAPSLSAAVPASGGVEAVARMDVVIALREWFGGERYARDYEYLDMQMGPQMKAMLEAVFKDRRERASLSPAPTSGSEAGGDWIDAEHIVNSEPVLKVYTACEWSDLNEDGQVWVQAIVDETVKRATASLKQKLLAALEAERANGSPDETGDVTFAAGAYDRLRSFIKREARND